MVQKRKADSEISQPQKRLSKPSSTVRRKDLGFFINTFGDIMPRACSNCRRLGLECKVHVRSGTCGECHLRGGVCDIRITQEEWQRLVSERARILREMKAALEAQEVAEQRRQEAERLRGEAERSRNVALQREASLRDELRQIEIEAEEAIAVEETQILALERHEAEQREAATDDSSASNGLALAPATWSACEGLSDDFWDPSPSIPWVLSDASVNRL